MSQRRFSRGVNDNDLTLEQRLVMQLSAAMRHDEQTPEEPAVSTPNHNLLENLPSNDHFGHANEPADWSNLIGSLSTALGNQPSVSADAHTHINKNVAPASTSNQPPVNQLPSGQSNMIDAPLNQPLIDFSNLDLSGLGNLRLSDLGILSNLGNLWDHHSADVNSQGTHMVDANNLLQTLGTLSHIGNLANQASHGNLESLGSLGNLANLGNLGNLGRLSNQSFNYSHTVPPSMPTNSSHTGLPSPAGLPLSTPTSAHTAPALDSNTPIARESAIGLMDNVPPLGSHDKPNELHLPNYASNKPPFFPPSSIDTNAPQSLPLQGVSNYTNAPQPAPNNNVTSPNTSADASVTHTTGASPKVNNVSVPFDASHQLTSHATTQNVSEPVVSSVSTPYNSISEKSLVASSTTAQPESENRTALGLRSAIEPPRDTFRSRESLLSLHEHIPTAIDPEVSSIQSVLQSLLTGGTVPGLDDNDSVENIVSDQPQSPPPSQDTIDGGTIESVNPATAFGNLSDLGLGAEDQALIESLRSVISLPDSAAAQNTVVTSRAGSQYSPSSLSTRLPRASADFSERISRPRATGSVSKYRKTKLPSRTEFESRPTETSSSEFNASDTDTLRAIQQALLSAMGPLASSTSLAESLTSTAAAHSAAAAAAQSQSPNKSPPDVTISAESSAAPSPTLSVLSDTPSKAGDPRSSKTSSLKKPIAKVIKPSEIDKQKVRDENAARKRKWREVHLMQNKDNDLRLRIMKRANEIYGSEESTKKTEWISEEFERRRQRRIFRAGINSIVDAARARAAKAAENGEPPRTPLEYARMHISDHARTLTQQSKQAATSHLSQLFRSSNAALGPQLHKDKVPLPMAAYMLVSSPRRPPYKITKAPKPCIEERPSSLHSKSDSDLTENTKDPQPTTNTTVILSGDPREISNKDNCSNEASDSLHSSAQSGSDTQSSTQDEVDQGKDQRESRSQSSTDSQNSAVFDLRPKHRYGLIGKLKLGVPPNLSAIYHKIRGTNPFDYQTTLSAQNS